LVVADEGEMVGQVAVEGGLKRADGKEMLGQVAVEGGL
jgi:hypothetical protein